MLLLHAQNIEKSYGLQTLFKIPELKVCDGDRLGIVGLNGSGKTTLLNILAGEDNADSGNVKQYCDVSYIHQFGVADDNAIDAKLERLLQLQHLEQKFLSGGEQTKSRIAEAFSQSSRILLADEPTSNLDINGIEILENILLKHQGAILIISHDREFLDRIVTGIIEIENSEIHIYKGNYSEYNRQKTLERERKQFEYEQYVEEKNRLQASLSERKQQARSILKVPRRMGNSEARLHRRESTEIEEKLHSSAKALKTRFQRLEVKERPLELPDIRMVFENVPKIISRIAFSANDIEAGFGTRTLFKNARFNIPTGSKTALIGGNGTGKTTLINMIRNDESGIRKSPGLKVGYFNQDFSALKPEKTVLENVLEDSIHSESATRSILARLLMKDNIFKRVSVLSGGELCKTIFAKLLISEANMLILDEPTNYLDLYSMEALQSVLNEYTGTILFVSHDRRFVNNLATSLLIIHDQMIESGDPETILQSSRGFISGNKKLASNSPHITLIQMRMAEIAVRLGRKDPKDNLEELEAEYLELSGRIKQIELLE